MSNKILFVFEGENTEFNIVDNLPKHFLRKTIVKTAYCNDVYEFYKEIENDEFLDTFSILKSIKTNKKILESFTPIDFAEIYLFFDYDGHDNLADDRKIVALLDFFSNETDKGKLYISYPMIESLKHLPKSGEFKDVVVSARENIKYKQYVDTQIENRYKQLGSFNDEIWRVLIDIHIRKLNYIVEGRYIVPVRLISQSEVFENQIKKYIQPRSVVSVLNSIPPFLCDYFGVKFIKKLVS